MDTPERRQVRDLVYATFASEGRAPSPEEVARKTHTTRDQAQDALHALADAHALVPAADGDAIRMAHPFSAAPMGFVVTPHDGHDDRRWWGGCAWDSFGISAALHLDVRIDTACPHCGAHLSYHAGPDTPHPPGSRSASPSPPHSGGTTSSPPAPPSAPSATATTPSNGRTSTHPTPGTSPTPSPCGDSPSRGTATDSIPTSRPTPATTTRPSSTKSASPGPSGTSPCNRPPSEHRPQPTTDST